MSLASKELFEDVRFCELSSQAMCAMCACESKMRFDKCSNCREELLYLTNVLLDFEV